MKRSPDAYAARLTVALDTYQACQPRSLQTEIGVSSVGHCHSETLYRLTGVAETDMPAARKSQHGTMLHAGYSAAMAWYDPSLIIEPELKVTLPSGRILIGHPDWIDPNEPSVTDYKSKDDEAALFAQRKGGSTEQQRYQRHLYGLGAIQAGLVPAEGLIVRNVWTDRAGQSTEPFVEQEAFDMAVVHDAERWLADIEYAAEHGEEVPKDKHYDWCARFCPFFTHCRSNDRPSLVVTDPEMVAAVEFLYSGREQSKEGGLLEKAAKVTLEPLRDSSGNGDMNTFLIGDYRFRWAWVNGSGDRAGYWKAAVERA